MEGTLTTRNSRRKIFTSWLVAAAIAILVFDAESFSVFPIQANQTSAKSVAFQMKRTEQKAPYDLTFWRLFENPLLAVAALTGWGLIFGISLPPAIRISGYAVEFSPWQNNAFEIPRGPPSEGFIF